MKRLIIAVIILSFINSAWAMSPDEQLLHAAQTGNFQLAQQAIEDGANIEARDINGWTPLHWAAYNGHTNVVRLLLDKNANIEEGNDGYTPLHCASFNGDIDIVKLILDRNANIDARDHNGCTPLHSAAYYGYTNVARLLLDRPNKSYIALVKKLQQDKTSRFFYLAKDITESVLPLFLNALDPSEKIEMIKARNNVGNTPSEIAIESGYSEMAAFLKEKKAFYRSQLLTNKNNQQSICAIQ